MTALGLLLLAILASVFWLSSENQQAGSTPELLPSAHAEAYAVYFTQPRQPQAASLSGGPDAPLAEAIRTARQSVDVAAFSLDLWSIGDALLAAEARGLRVRLVVESDNALSGALGQLRQAGVQIAEDGRRPLMHHKFVVIDGREVWTGSMNLTVSGVYRDHNNLLRVRSGKMAANYEVEFEEMFIQDRFGPLSLANTPFPAIEEAGGVRMEVYFSPEDGAGRRLLELIEAGRGSIDFLAFTFTQDKLAEAMRAKADSGIRVRGVIEAEQAQVSGSEYASLRQAGIPVRLDSLPHNMHHKVIILDGSVVVTGSYNFTRSAEELNDENLIIVHDRALAQAYLREFEAIFEAGLP